MFKTGFLIYFLLGSSKSDINSLRYDHLKSRKRVLFQCVCKNIRTLRALFSIKLIHNLYLNLFHWIQNRSSVLLSIGFIKIGYKLMEIRCPKVNKLTDHNLKPKLAAKVGFGFWFLVDFFLNDTKNLFCIIKFNT